MNNMSSYYGLVDAKIRVSDKDLPVMGHLQTKYIDKFWLLLATYPPKWGYEAAQLMHILKITNGYKYTCHIQIILPL